MRTETVGARGGAGPRIEARLDHPELRLVTPQPSWKDTGDVDEPEGPAGTAQLDAHQLESLLLNLDASLRVTTRAQFFSWTQGLLLNLIRHRVLVCALRRSRDPAFTVDCFSTLVGSSLGEALAREPSLLSVLADKWTQRHFAPFVIGIEELADVGGAALRDLARAGATELLVHGTHDADGEVTGLSVFACQGGMAAREKYLAQLLTPSLHAAWVRTQTHRTGTDPRAAANGNCILTERERGILRWVYLGKSNGEIGAILGISALTVKNHVQKILRKLNVVNRAQAVGRALDARIIRP